MKELPLPRGHVDAVFPANIDPKDLICLVAYYPECYINMDILPLEHVLIREMINIDLHAETWSFNISHDLAGSKIDLDSLPKYFDPEILKSISVDPDTLGMFNFDDHKVPIGAGIIEVNLINSLQALRLAEEGLLSSNNFCIIGVYNRKNRNHLKQIAQDAALWGHLMNKGE